jgi:MFS family permease
VIYRHGVGAGRIRVVLWAGTLGVVLADSSVVTLALPEILREYDTTVFGVSWVLTAFNLALAVAILPAARIAQRAPGRTWALGLVAFSAASLACAVAPSIAALIAARCVQALGGAAVIAGAIELLARATGSHAAAAGRWGTAGLAGLALGPAIGGLLTDLVSWESIFLLQVPVLLAAVAARAPADVPEAGSEAPLDPRPEVALALLSAGLTGALFLLVVMLTEGWLYSPLEAALVVSAMPVATLAARALARRLGDDRPVVAAGAICMAGGLAALGLLPDAGAGWTLAPQVLVGAGIALALPGLTTRALSGRDPHGRRAATTIAARHAGIVLGILALTPVLSARFDTEHEAARLSGTALVLDAPLDPDTKVALGEELGETIAGAGGRLPELGPSFDEVEPLPEEAGDYAALETALVEEVDKAATHAFSLPFLLAGAIAALALLPVYAGRRW